MLVLVDNAAVAKFLQFKLLGFQWVDYPLAFAFDLLCPGLNLVHRSLSRPEESQKYWDIVLDASYLLPVTSICRAYQILFGLDVRGNLVTSLCDSVIDCIETIVELSRSRDQSGAQSHSRLDVRLHLGCLHTLPWMTILQA